MFMINKSMLNKIMIIIICSFFSLSLTSYCFELENDYTNEYKSWLEASENKKKNMAFPEALASIMSENDNINFWTNDYRILNYYSTDIRDMLEFDKFNLSDYINLNIRNQENSKSCWAIGTLTSMESNLAYKNGVEIEFSENHMDMSTSNKNTNGMYIRDSLMGGIPEIGLAYLTNGQGAVLESDDNIDKPTYYVDDYVRFPSIYKKYDNDEITYYDSYGNLYSNEDVGKIRNQIKRYIKENGSIIGVTASNYIKGYDGRGLIVDSKSFCCRENKVNRDHVISIVGWDDNYSKENFSKMNKPSTNGAYIVLQSYGKDYYDNGYMYVSYEDALIETVLYGIDSSKKYDYDYLYQNDYYGANTTLKIKDCNSAYFSTIYERKNKSDEQLTKVSINIPQISGIEVWVNPNGSDVSLDKLIKISDFKTFEPGYHTIDVDKTSLKGNEFAVVIKQVVENNDLYFNAETKLDDIFYSNVKSAQNKISIDGKKWIDFNQLQNKDANLCIKAFCCKE